MKVRKFLPLLLSLLMVGGAFAGCAKGDNGGTGGTGGTGGGTEDVGGGTGGGTGEEKPEHKEHTWSTKYSYENEDGHYYVTTCTEHGEIKGELHAHNYNARYKCKDCGYQHEHVWTEGLTFKNGTGHYKATTCLSHRILKENVEEHVFDNDEDTTCNKCDYVRIPPHEHTWSEVLVNDNEKGHHKTATCAGHEDQISDCFDHEFAAGSDTCACGYERKADTSAPLASGSTVYVVGDSTVCAFNDSYYMPRYGYGTQLAQYLNVQESQINNLAMSGRSSKSFLTESNYATLKSSIKAGDYLIIGFGHNDEKSAEAARFTDPNGTHTEAKTAKGDSFQYILYENYVKMAKDKGATPILCTPIVRYSSSGDYAGTNAHITADGDYAGAIRKLGAATGTVVIDLTALTKELYESNNAEAQYFHAHTACEGREVVMPTGRDNTHINKFGAETVAYLFANSLKDTDCPLKAQVYTDKTMPAKGTHLPQAIKEGFVPADYKEFDPDKAADSTKLTDGWYRTTMGGGTGNFTNTYADGKFTVGESTVKGKIASSNDVFAAAFMQVDVRKNFKASATVTVKSKNEGLTNSQGGFGMMLRDDMDMVSTSLASNYVAAGLLNLKAPVFSRESGALNSSGSSPAIAVGDTYKVSITRVGQTVTVTFGDVTKTFTDFDFVAVDGDYMYLCLFAARGVVAEFTDVKFEITGNAQAA